MKKLLVVAVIAAFLFSGCGINSEQISGNDQNITEDRLGLPTPLANEVAWIFNTEQEFTAAIKDGSTENGGSKHSLKEIKYYFVPEAIPEGVTLDHIAVKDFYVALWYTYDKEPDPNYERTFVFSWERAMGSGDIEMNVRRMFSEEDIERYNDYMIVKVKPYDENDTREYMRQDVFWEQGGYAFHAVVPVSFSKDDIAKYCVAKKVDVN